MLNDFQNYLKEVESVSDDKTQQDFNKALKQKSSTLKEKKITEGNKLSTDSKDFLKLKLAEKKSSQQIKIEIGTI